MIPGRITLPEPHTLTIIFTVASVSAVSVRRTWRSSCSSCARKAWRRIVSELCFSTPKQQECMAVPGYARFWSVWGIWWMMISR